MSKENKSRNRIANLVAQVKSLKAEVATLKELADVRWTPFVRIGGEQQVADLTFVERYQNSRYHVSIRKVNPHDGTEPDSIFSQIPFPKTIEYLIHLSIKRVDQTSRVSWRDLQRIKNEICGPETEAVQLYPSEKRMVDTANQYHLWVLPAGNYWPVGWMTRVVSETTDVANVVQDRWEDDESRPTDLVHIPSVEAMRQVVHKNKIV